MRVIDLFCGAGGFSEGFRQAGFEIVAAVDSDEKALAAHMRNHPETDHILAEIGHPEYADHLIEILRSYKADIVIGSPPCQSFSIANASKDAEKGMELVHEFVRIVDELKPSYWVGENVPPSAQHITGQVGYTGYELNSADFGVPQKRKRFSFGYFPRPERSHEEGSYRTIADIMERNGRTQDMWMPFEDLPKTAKKRVLDHEYQKVPRNNFYKMKYPEETPGVLPAHQDVSNLLVVSTANASGRSNTFARSTLEATWTMTTRNNYFLANDVIFRRFTNTELKRIMGFPDDYHLEGSRTSKIRQLGNAVCPPVAKAIAEAIAEGRPVDLKVQSKLDDFFEEATA